MLAADRADDVLVVGDELIHLIKAHGIHIDLRMLLTDQLIGTVACLAGTAVQQGVREAGNVPVVTQVWGFIMMAASRPTL